MHNIVKLWPRYGVEIFGFILARQPAASLPEYVHDIESRLVGRRARHDVVLLHDSSFLRCV